MELNFSPRTIANLYIVSAYAPPGLSGEVYREVRDKFGLHRGVPTHINDVDLYSVLQPALFELWRSLEDSGLDVRDILTDRFVTQ